jgi:hypothetical protein
MSSWNRSLVAPTTGTAGTEEAGVVEAAGVAEEAGVVEAAAGGITTSG